MAGKFVLSIAKNGKFLFNLKAGNGEVILTSQLYAEKASAVHGIDSVRKNAGDDSKFERKTSTDEKPFFVLIAGNGQTIGKSELYQSVKSMENGIASVKKNAPDALLADETAAK